MTRDMTDWPEVLTKALAAGVAPTLDELAERARREFWREDLPVVGDGFIAGDEGVLYVYVPNLAEAAMAVIRDTPAEVLQRALTELWALNQYAFPHGSSHSTLFFGAITPKDYMMDLLCAAICVRCRLDEATEQEDRIRPQSRPRGRGVAVLAILGEGPMTLDELVDYLRANADDESEPCE